MRMDLGEKPGLHLLGDFDFLSGAAFVLELLSQGAAMRFDAAGKFVKAGKPEEVAVGILKACVDSSPGGNLWRKLEADTASLPLLILAIDVFGNEPNAGLGANEFLGIIIGLEEGQAEVGASIGGTNLDPSLAVV